MLLFVVTVGVVADIVALAETKLMIEVVVKINKNLKLIIEILDQSQELQHEVHRIIVQ